MNDAKGLATFIVAKRLALDPETRPFVPPWKPEGIWHRFDSEVREVERWILEYAETSRAVEAAG